MKRLFLRIAMGFFMSLMMTGCATSQSFIGVDSRVGTIVKFYALEELRHAAPACLSDLSSEKISQGRYVEIRIYHGRRHEYTYAFLPSNLPAAVHDEVEIKPKYCEKGTVPKVINILQ